MTKTVKKSKVKYVGPTANRTMDLLLLTDTDDGKIFVQEFNNFKAILGSFGVRWHIDGDDNPLRRYWEYYWLLKHTPIINNARILDVGSGISPFQFFILHKNPTAHLIAIDDESQTPNFYKFCNNAAHKLGLADRYDCLKMDAVDGECYQRTFENEEFDHIFSVSVIEHIPNDMKLIANMCRWLRPSGTLSITFDFHKDSFPTRKDRLYTVDDIARIVKEARKRQVKLKFNTKFIDLTNWDEPPVNLGPPPDYKYNFGALFFSKSLPIKKPIKELKKE